MSNVQVRILHCPDKRFRPYIIRAINFYAKELALQKLFIKIKFQKLEDSILAETGPMNKRQSPRRCPNNDLHTFEILISSGLTAATILTTLAHEMVHIKQFVFKELNYEGICWKGEPLPLDYYDDPSEIEAYGREVGLYHKYKCKEKLWTVFQNISNPKVQHSNSPATIQWR